MKPSEPGSPIGGGAESPLLTGEDAPPNGGNPTETPRRTYPLALLMQGIVGLSIAIVVLSSSLLVLSFIGHMATTAGRQIVTLGAANGARRVDNLLVSALKGSRTSLWLSRRYAGGGGAPEDAMQAQLDFSRSVEVGAWNTQEHFYEASLCLQPSTDLGLVTMPPLTDPYNATEGADRGQRNTTLQLLDHVITSRASGSGTPSARPSVLTVRAAPVVSIPLPPLGGNVAPLNHSSSSGSSDSNDASGIFTLALQSWLSTSIPFQAIPMPLPAVGLTGPLAQDYAAALQPTPEQIAAAVQLRSEATVSRLSTPKLKSLRFTATLEEFAVTTDTIATNETSGPQLDQVSLLLSTSRSATMQRLPINVTLSTLSFPLTPGGSDRLLRGVDNAAAPSIPAGETLSHRWVAALEAASASSSRCDSAVASSSSSASLRRLYMQTTTTSVSAVTVETSWVYSTVTGFLRNRNVTLLSDAAAATALGNVLTTPVGTQVVNSTLGVCGGGTTVSPNRSALGVPAYVAAWQWDPSSSSPNVRQASWRQQSTSVQGASLKGSFLGGQLPLWADVITNDVSPSPNFATAGLNAFGMIAGGNGSTFRVPRSLPLRWRQKCVRPAVNNDSSVAALLEDAQDGYIWFPSASTTTASNPNPAARVAAFVLSDRRPAVAGVQGVIAVPNVLADARFWAYPTVGDARLTAQDTRNHTAAQNLLQEVNLVMQVAAWNQIKVSKTVPVTGGGASDAHVGQSAYPQYLELDLWAIEKTATAVAPPSAVSTFRYKVPFPELWSSSAQTTAAMVDEAALEGQDRPAFTSTISITSAAGGTGGSNSLTTTSAGSSGSVTSIAHGYYYRTIEALIRLPNGISLRNLPTATVGSMPTGESLVYITPLSAMIDSGNEEIMGAVILAASLQPIRATEIVTPSPATTRSAPSGGNTTSVPGTTVPPVSATKSMKVDFSFIGAPLSSLLAAYGNDPSQDVAIAIHRLPNFPDSFAFVSVVPLTDLQNQASAPTRLILLVAVGVGTMIGVCASLMIHFLSRSLTKLANEMLLAGRIFDADDAEDDTTDEKGMKRKRFHIGRIQNPDASFVKEIFILAKGYQTLLALARAVKAHLPEHLRTASTFQSYLNYTGVDKDAGGIDPSSFTSANSQNSFTGLDTDALADHALAASMSVSWEASRSVLVRLTYEDGPTSAFISEGTFVFVFAEVDGNMLDRLMVECKKVVEEDPFEPVTLEMVDATTGLQVQLRHSMQLQENLSTAPKEIRVMMIRTSLRQIQPFFASLFDVVNTVVTIIFSIDVLKTQLPSTSIPFVSFFVVALILNAMICIGLIRSNKAPNFSIWLEKRTLEVVVTFLVCMPNTMNLAILWSNVRFGDQCGRCLGGGCGGGGGEGDSPARRMQEQEEELEGGDEEMTSERSLHSAAMLVHDPAVEDDDQPPHDPFEPAWKARMSRWPVIGTLLGKRRFRCPRLTFPQAHFNAPVEPRIQRQSISLSVFGFLFSDVAQLLYKTWIVYTTGTTGLKVLALVTGGISVLFNLLFKVHAMLLMAADAGVRPGSDDLVGGGGGFATTGTIGAMERTVSSAMVSIGGGMRNWLSKTRPTGAMAAALGIGGQAAVDTSADGDGRLIIKDVTLVRCRFLLPPHILQLNLRTIEYNNFYTVAVKTAMQFHGIPILMHGGDVVLAFNAHRRSPHHCLDAFSFASSLQQKCRQAMQPVAIAVVTVPCLAGLLGTMTHKALHCFGPMDSMSRLCDVALMMTMPSSSSSSSSSASASAWGGGAGGTVIGGGGVIIVAGSALRFVGGNLYQAISRGVSSWPPSDGAAAAGKPPHMHQRLLCPAEYGSPLTVPKYLTPVAMLFTELVRRLMDRMERDEELQRSREPEALDVPGGELNRSSSARAKRSAERYERAVRLAGSIVPERGRPAPPWVDEQICALLHESPPAPSQGTTSTSVDYGYGHFQDGAGVPFEPRDMVMDRARRLEAIIEELLPKTTSSLLSPLPAHRHRRLFSNASAAAAAQQQSPAPEVEDLGIPKQPAASSSRPPRAVWKGPLITPAMIFNFDEL